MENNEYIKIVEFKTNKTQFVPVYFDLLDVEELLSGEEKMLYILLCRFWNDEKKCAYPSFSLIGKKTSWGKDKIIKYIKSLEEKGLLERKKNLDQALKNNEYTLYDIALVKQQESKQEFLFISIIEHIKQAEENDTTRDYTNLRNFIEGINKKKSIDIKGKPITVEEIFDKLAPVQIDKLMNVFDRVEERTNSAKINNNFAYLVTSILEADLTEVF